MRIIRNSMAVLAVALAIPSAAQAATTITVSVAAPAAGDTTPFTFHVTGPACGVVPTDLTFVLTGGQNKVLPLCDSPTDLPHRFHITETLPAGWKLTSIDCTGFDPDPADAFVVDIPTATAFVELSPNENKACSFSNAMVPAVVPPPAPPVPAVTPPAAKPAPVVPVPAASGVAGEQQRSPVRATAAVRAQSRCGTRTARVTVSGRRMRQVRFSLNGRSVRTVDVGLGVRSITALLPVRRSGPAVQKVRARVTFRNGAPARTLNATVRRCAQGAVSPQFTG